MAASDRPQQRNDVLPGARVLPPDLQEPFLQTKEVRRGKQVEGILIDRQARHLAELAGELAELAKAFQ
jgi:hypothetical protein